MNYLYVLMLTTSLSTFASDALVVITDSHGVGHFGEVLTERLRQRTDTRFSFFASGGSAPLQWLNNAFTSTCAFAEGSGQPKEPRKCKKLLTPRLSDVWIKLAPLPSERTITVIIQGTNYSLKPSMRSEQIRHSSRLIDVALDKSDLCIWVGPPAMRRAPDFDAQALIKKVDIIQAANQNRCHFIDSRDLSTYPPVGDGIHYHWPGSTNAEQLRESETWATSVMARLEEIL